MSFINTSKNGFAHIPILIVIALLAVGTGTVAASDKSKPGDLLYPIDRSIENMRLSSITDDKEKAEFKARVLGERISEAEELELEEGREVDRDTAVAAAEDEMDELETLVAAGVLSADDLSALFERYNITELEYSVEEEDGQQKVELKIKGTDEDGNEFEFESENESEESEIEDDEDLNDDSDENNDMDDEDDEDDQEEGEEDSENDEKTDDDNEEEDSENSDEDELENETEDNS